MGAQFSWLTWILLFAAALWIVLYRINRAYDLKKHGITIEYGMLMWRTKRGLRLMDRIANASKRGWLAFGTAAAAIGTALMIFVFANFALNAAFILKQPAEALPGARFVIPGITIPLIAGVIAILSVLIVHELAHGIVIRAQGLPTKSVGALLLLLIPGAFVEPDEERLKASPVPKRMRVFGAGSFANVILSLICLGVILLVVVPKPGVYVWGVRENGPSYNVLSSGMRLLEIDNVAIDSYWNFYDVMKNVEPGDNLNVLTDQGFFLITAAKHRRENFGDMGIIPISAIPPSSFKNPLIVAQVMVEELLGYPVFHKYTYDARVPWSFIDILKWMFVLNMGIGLFNLLPAVPLDGGYLISGLVEWRSSAKTARRVSYALSILVLAILIINIAPVLW